MKGAKIKNLKGGAKVCRITMFPEEEVFSLRVMKSVFGFSVIIVSQNVEGDNIITGDKHSLRKKIKKMNVENGCLGVCYDDYSRLEKIKTHILCLYFSPIKYFANLVKRNKIQSSPVFGQT